MPSAPSRRPNHLSAATSPEEGRPFPGNGVPATRGSSGSLTAVNVCLPQQPPLPPPPTPPTTFRRRSALQAVAPAKQPPGTRALPPGLASHWAWAYLLSHFFPWLRRQGPSTAARWPAGSQGGENHLEIVISTECRLSDSTRLFGQRGARGPWQCSLEALAGEGCLHRHETNRRSGWHQARPPAPTAGGAG